MAAISASHCTVTSRSNSMHESCKNGEKVKWVEVFGISSPHRKECVCESGSIARRVRAWVSAGKSTRGASDFRPCSIEGSKNKGPDRAHNPGISFFKRAETMKLFRALFPGPPGNKTGRLLCHRQERIDFRGFSNERGNKLLLVIARGVSGYGWDVEFWEVDIRGGFRPDRFMCAARLPSLYRSFPSVFGWIPLSNAPFPRAAVGCGIVQSVWEKMEKKKNSKH